jgi:hypothetical protein
MRRILMTALATAALGLGMSAPARAAATITQCTSGSSCVSGTTNVNLGSFTNASMVTGNVGIGGPEVDFTSTNGNLSTNSGAATIFTASGDLLTNLTFQLVTGSFTAAEFNLENGSPSAFTITLHTTGGSDVVLNGTSLQGSNIFDIVAPAGSSESYTGATFTTTNGGFNDFKQLRLVLAPGSVPEPATWAMMLLGFGGIGMAMRRRRRSQALMQVA